MGSRALDTAELAAPFARHIAAELARADVSTVARDPLAGSRGDDELVCGLEALTVRGEGSGSRAPALPPPASLVPKVPWFKSTGRRANTELAAAIVPTTPQPTGPSSSAGPPGARVAQAPEPWQRGQHPSAGAAGLAVGADAGADGDVYGSVALVVVDTNVWLDELERLRAWAPLHRARLACPFAVVRELDGLKNSDSAQLAGKARAALRFILQEAAAPAGIVVVQAFHQVFHLLDASGAHAPANADEQILDYALWLLRARTAAAALLSHDVALCVKAAANGVPHGPKGVLEALERAGRVARAQLASQSQPVHPQPRAQPPLPLPPPRPQQPQHAAHEPSLPPPVAVSSAPAPAVAAHADPPAAVAPAEPRADALPPAPARPPAPPELAGPPRAHEAGVGVDELARSLAARDKELLALREQHAALEQALATLSLTQAAAAKGGAQPAGSQAVGAGARAARLAARPELVDLLSATAEQFQTLPGVGPALARRIVEFREREPLLLRTAADLLRVKGLGPKVVEVIKQSGQLLGSA